MEQLERTLSILLQEYASLFKIAYAILYQPYRRCIPMLILRFLIDEPDERFRLSLEFMTILPPTPIELHDVQSLTIDVLKEVFRYGKVLYLGDYNLYLRDLKQVVNANAISR